ncbi:MAG: ABC transporter permease, partial [bacterium]
MKPKTAPAWRRYLRFWGSNVPQDVEDELRFHLDMRTRDFVARGMSETSARDAATARLGQIDQARAACLAIGRENERRARQGDVLDRIAADIRFALRSFRRSPGWTSVAIATIAIGIGSSTAVFGIVDRLLVHPVTYPHADRIVVVRRDIRISPTTNVWAAPSAEQVDAWRRAARALERIEPYGRRDLSLTIGAEAMSVHTASIDTGFLSLVGAHPVAGRSFSADDVAPNAPAVAMLAEPFWRREFGSARDVIGKTLLSPTGRITIVGIV